jgi:nucleoid-associated protein YgaU
LLSASPFKITRRGYFQQVTFSSLVGPPRALLAPDLSAKLAETEDKLATTLRSFSQLQTENDRLKAAATDRAKLQDDLNHLRDEKTALEAKLNAPPSPDLSAKLAETEDKLATTLRSFSQLQAENDRLKAGAADTAKLNDELESLRAEKAAFETRLAEAKTPAAPPADDARVSAAESKLETALRAYSQLQSENERLRTEAANNAANAQATAAKSATESATQLAALFDELRQTKAQVTALSAENVELKTRLALAGPPPGSLLLSPSRPGAAIARSPAPAPAADAAAQGPRQHVVAPGDTLAKISRQYYGTPNRWDEIQRANPDLIKNENALPIGATLQIP